MTIGNNVLFAPSVQIYTATHPISAAERRKWLESAKPITIGSDVWVGGGAIICPGVTIGDRISDRCRKCCDASDSSGRLCGR